jgi:hypothetical protein
MPRKPGPRFATMHPDQSDPLAPLLDQWGRPPPLPPIAAAVRHRLAGRSRPASEPGSLLARPAFALMFAAACVLLGLFLAEVRLSALHRERDARLLESYRKLIDPLITAAPFPAATPHSVRS